MEPIPFFSHDLGEQELKAIAEVLQGPILTTGDVVEGFERRFSEYAGAQHTVGLTSCTAALHLSLLALGIRPGDEVITTPMTFLATATAILQAGARPVFVDVEPETGNLDAARIEAAINERTRAIIPVHLYGQMCDMRAMREIADRHRLVVIEDAAHCLEGERDGVRPGDLADAACFSFYPTKSITSGEGGAVITNDAELAQRLRLMRLHGMTSSAAQREREGYQHWDMVDMGWKYNMDNIQAAMLLPQMDRLVSSWERRARLARRYREGLEPIAGVSGPSVVPGGRHAEHLLTIWVEPAIRDAVIEGLKQKKVGIIVTYRAVHLTTYFRRQFGYARGRFPKAERIGDSTISLPLYPTMPERYVSEVLSRLADVVEPLR